MDSVPTWLSEAYRKFGADIAASDMGRYRVMRLTGLGEKRSRTLVDHVRAHGAPTEPDVNEEEGTADWLWDTKYVYNKDTDTYVTFVRSAPKPVVMPGVTHRAIIKAYSNWDGQPATINQICRQFRIPRSWLIEYLRIHQVTHDSEPFSREEIKERPIIDMVEEALQARRQVVHQKFEIEKWKEIKKAADKWMDFEQSVLASLIEHTQNAPSYKPLKLELPRASNPYAFVTSATDFHWGMYAWEGETNAPYSRKEAERRLFEQTQDLLSRLPGAPEKIVLAVGSDFFHCDGDNAATTRGTPLDIEGTPTEILITGCELTRTHIDILRQVAPVEVVLMTGNHDRHNALALQLYLAAWYRGCDDVEVVMDFKPRVYRQYGETLMGFHHGDHTKTKDLGACMAVEARKQWGETQYHIFFGGHLHHQHVQEIGGIVHYQLPSLAGSDRWHTRSGYVTAIPGLAGYVVDKYRGVVGTLFAPVLT